MGNMEMPGSSWGHDVKIRWDRVLRREKHMCQWKERKECAVEVPTKRRTLHARRVHCAGDRGQKLDNRSKVEQKVANGHNRDVISH